MEQVRDILLLKIIPDAREKLDMAEDDVTAMTPLAERFSQEDLLRIMDAVAREEGRIRFSAQPRYLLEALAVRLCHLADLTPLEELLARFPDEPDEDEERPASTPSPRGGTAPERTPPTRSATVSPPALLSVVPVSDAPAPQDVAPDVLTPAAGEPGEVRRQVETILERVYRERSTLGGFLSHAIFFDLEDSAFVISLPEDKAMFRASIERKEYVSFIRDTVEAVTGRRLDVKVRLSQPAPAPGIAAPAAGGDDREAIRKQLLEEANRSPVVKSFLDLFQGEITDIEEV
jgi:hypothetical protein